MSAPEECVHPCALTDAGMQCRDEECSSSVKVPVECVQNIDRAGAGRHMVVVSPS